MDNELQNGGIFCNSYVLQLSTDSTCSTKLTSLSGLSSLERSFQTTRHLDDLADFPIPKVRKGPCRQCLSVVWMRCSTKHNQLPANPTLCQRVKHAFLCPPHGPPSLALGLLLAFLLLWGCLWSFTGSEALPGGRVFSLIVILTLGHVAGQLLSIINVPPLIGKYKLQI